MEFHLQLLLAKISLLLISVSFASQGTYSVSPSSTLETPLLVQSGASGDVWAGYPLLKRICAAESNYNADNEPRQFLPDGSILWGWDHGKILHRDVGACQENLWVWGAKAKAMDLDIVNSEADNITFAKFLFDKYGSAPWNASKEHWSSD
jgi:hypothetical protein